MSAIIDETLNLIRNLIPNLDQILIEYVHLGEAYTGVKLSTGHVGICHSLLGETSHRSPQAVWRTETLNNVPALDIAELARSQDLRESVVGVAALNALSQAALTDGRFSISEGNLMDYIAERVTKSDEIALIGHIRPFVNTLRERGRHLYVFERSPRLSCEETLPDTLSEEVLPKADIVIVTGSTIANKTIDRILELSRTAREVGVVGPSAGIVPDPLFKRGVTIVGTIRVIDPDKLMEIVKEGGGTRQIKSAVRFINIRPKEREGEV